MAVIATRRERVVLDLETNFPREAAEAAAAIRLLNEEINHLGGKGSNRSALKTVSKDMEDVGRKADRAAPSIDKFSGRVGLLAKSVAAIGPSLIPISAVAIPAITGLASSFGFAAIAGGTMIGAFQGVGDALKALDKAHLEPTTENINAAKVAMAQISPEARKFTRELQSLEPELKRLRDTAATGLFPGLTEGLDQMQGALPAIQRIVGAVSGELGELAAEGGKSLAGPRWAAFFDFLADEAPQALADMAHGVGNVAHAMASLWMAFAPVNRSFSSWLVDSTADLDKWATGLSKTQGFADFIDYIQSAGPQVGATLGAIANALLQIVQAAAPIGGPVLKVIETLADAIAKIADSDIGTPLFGMVAALSALSLAMSAGRSIQGKFVSTQGQLVGGFEKQRTSLRALSTDWHAYNAVTNTAQGRAKAGATQIFAQREAAERLRGSLRSTAVEAGKAGALVGALGLVTTGAADKFGIANTATLALAGSMAGPWGAAAGAAAGAALDLAHANDGLSDSLAKLNTMAGKVDFGTFNSQVDDAQKKVDDLKHVTGVGDWFSDAFKQLGNVLSGKGADGGVANAQNKINKSEVSQDASLRERGAAAANAAMAASSKLAANGFRLTAAGAREAAGGIAAFTAAAERANNAISRQGVFDAYRSSLLDFQDALKANGKTLDKNTRAGLANRDALRNMASAANAAGASIKDAGDHAKYMQKARKSFIDAAVAAGATRAQAKRLADQFGLIGRINVKPKITSNAEAERARIRALQNQINALRGKTVTITVLRNTKGGTAPGGGVLNQPGVDGSGADGATVPKTGLPYADRHLYLLADGEEVISNRRGQADRFRADRASGRIPRYADGGTIGRLADGGEARRHPNRHPNHPHKNDDDKDGKAHDHLRNRIRALTKAIEQSKKTIDKERTARDDLLSKRNDLASTVSDKFTTDLFGSQPANLSWMNASQKQAALTGGVFSTLKSDISNANTFKATLAGLKKRGLDGQALAELASSGDVQRAQAFSKLSSKDLGSYETLYNQRAAATAGVGAYAGNAVFGAQIATQTKVLQAQLAETKAMNKRLVALEKKKATIHVHEAKNPKHTAKEVSRRQAMAG